MGHPEETPQAIARNSAKIEIANAQARDARTRMMIAYGLTDVELIYLHAVHLYRSIAMSILSSQTRTNSKRVVGHKKPVDRLPKVCQLCAALTNSLLPAPTIRDTERQSTYCYPPSELTSARARQRSKSGAVPIPHEKRRLSWPTCYTTRRSASVVRWSAEVSRSKACSGIR
jgi:hypothetical protein